MLARLQFKNTSAWKNNILAQIAMNQHITCVKIGGLSVANSALYLPNLSALPGVQGVYQRHDTMTYGSWNIELVCNSFDDAISYLEKYIKIINDDPLTPT